MFDAYNNLEPLLKIYWGIALFASLIFIIQAIMTFIGLGGGDDVDTDIHDGGGMHHGELPFQLFSFRNLINFLLGFGWTGISLYNAIPNKIVLGFVAFIVGLVFIFLFFLIIKQLMKLAENNSFRIEETVGKIADVYLTVPANKTGRGKIMVSVKGAVHELSAITEDAESIETGAVVKITDTSADIVIVTKV